MENPSFFPSDDESRAIWGLVEHFRSMGRSVNSMSCRPDQKDRTNPEIDAIALPYAIEHTTIDLVKNQRSDNSAFRRFVDPIEHRLRVGLSYGIFIALNWSDAKLISRNRDIAADFEAWLEKLLSGLPDGYSLQQFAIKNSIGSMDVRIWKFGRFAGTFSFMRNEPATDLDLANLKKLMDRKAAKLANYRVEPKGPLTTVLLLEAEDVALLEPTMVEKAVNSLFPGGCPNGVDEVWLCQLGWYFPLSAI